MKRILIIGCPGSGKSYFAKRLGEITNLPVVHMDNKWLGSTRKCAYRWFSKMGNIFDISLHGYRLYLYRDIHYSLIR